MERMPIGAGAVGPDGVSTDLPPSAINAALKEWAIVCRALGDGRQILLIRKGGIEEMKDGFQVAHRNFWLFPTYVHQKAADLVPAFQAEFEAVQSAQPLSGTVEVQLYATVEDVVRVTDVAGLRRLEGLHILSRDCVVARFHYRNRPGVHVLAVRVYRRPDPYRLQASPWYDGCVSWVQLDEPLATHGCVPVLADADFAARLADLRARLSSDGIAR
jgi:hypothetical protein